MIRAGGRNLVIKARADLGRGQGTNLASSVNSEPRYTATWWAVKHGLPDDLDSRLVLGATAARLARWYGLAEAKVTEGSYTVHTWPAAVWTEAVALLAQARTGIS